MSNIPEELKYTETHEWIRSNSDGTLTVGITDHAQQALGDLVFVEVNAAGETLSAGDACAVVESVKAASDVYCPVAAELLESNGALEDAPELINSDPYGDGWLFKIKPADGADTSSLLNAGAYADSIAE